MASKQVYARTAMLNQANVQRNPEEFYDQWADEYEKDMQTERYDGPTFMADLCGRHFKKTDRLLDICAGTGLVAQHLKKSGYTNVDGLDASQKMLDLAKVAQLYNEYIHCVLDPDKPSPIGDSTYDGAFCLGAVAPGHLNPTHFQEMLRVVKTDGILIMSVNANYVRPVDEGERKFPYDVTKSIEDLERDGKVKILDRVDGPFYGAVSAVYFVLSIC